MSTFVWISVVVLLIINSFVTRCEFEDRFVTLRRFYSKDESNDKVNFLTYHLAKTSYENGLKLENIGNTSEAIDHMERCYQFKVLEPSCSEKLTDLYTKIGKIDEAGRWFNICEQEYIQTINELATNYFQDYIYVLHLITSLGSLYFRYNNLQLSCETNIKALDFFSLHFKQADGFMIDKSATESNILYSIGLSYQHMGDIMNAHSYYWRSIDVNPSHSRSRLNLAAILHQNQQWFEAIHHYTYLIDNVSKSILNINDSYSFEVPTDEYHYAISNSILAHFQAGEITKVRVNFHS